MHVKYFTLLNRSINRVSLFRSSQRKLPYKFGYVSIHEQYNAGRRNCKKMVVNHCDVAADFVKTSNKDLNSPYPTNPLLSFPACSV